MDEYIHISQNGKETLLKDLALPHLKNICAKIEQLADKEFIKVLKNERYHMYVDELKRRQDNE